jgi:hypothetical protein
MLRRLGERRAEVTRELTRLSPKAPPAPQFPDYNVPTADQMKAAQDQATDRQAEKAAAVAKLQTLRSALDGLLAEQTRVFGIVQAEQAKVDSWFSKPDVIEIAQQLTKLQRTVYPQWDATLAQAREAAAAAGEPADKLPVPARSWWQHLNDVTFK